MNSSYKKIAFVGKFSDLKAFLSQVGRWEEFKEKED